MTTLLSVDEVFAAYQPGVDILQGMSLTVPKGGFVLVIGPNGCLLYTSPSPRD